MTPIFDAALAATRANIGVLPIKSDGTKAPDVASWTPYQKQRPTHDQVVSWFGHGAYSGYALICGPSSGNLECLDFDDADTYQLFLDTAEAIGLGEIVARMRAGFEERTPGEGAHLLFYCETTGQNTTLAARPLNDPARPKQKFEALIETRGNGGYVVVAPSNGTTHPSGKAWRLVSGSIETIATITPVEREELFRLARSLDQRPSSEQSRQAPTEGATDAEGTKPGDDYRAKHTTVESVTKLLEHHDWRFLFEKGGTAYYRRPGKDRGISATFNHNGSGLFYCFSSSTEFDNGRGYNVFGLYAILEHSGDFSAAAKELARQGYGSQPKQPKLKLRTAAKGTPGGAEDQNEAPNGEEPEEKKFRLTDLGNAERLIAKHGADIRYCKLWSKWLVFDGRRWANDNSLQIERWAQQVARDIFAEANKATDLEMREKLAKHSLASEKARSISGMVELAKARVPIDPGQLDRDIWALNCQNGTLDLKTGELHPHDRDDYITKLVPVDYNPRAKASRWEAFMLQIAAGDADLVAFEKRALGYSICGDQSERILLLCHGGGRNGKTVMVETVAATLGGDYASIMAAESLMQRRGGDDDRLMQRRAALRGMRFVVASETGEGARLNEALIKSLTGNERITARHLYGEQFEFDPTHTLWLATNHRPGIRDTTNSIWDRLKLIPFSVRFVTDDEATGEPGEIHANKKLGKELLREKQGVLAWLVAGCLEWQEQGVGTAKRVKEATQEYRTDEDLLGRFIAECCHVGRKAAIQASQLYGVYTKWCEDNGERPITQTAFGRALTERGFERKRRESGIEWQGIGLRTDGAACGKMHGSVRSEPHFDKPPHESRHTDSYGETIHNHTDHTSSSDEVVF